ncbi:molecular chaperone DjlA [Aureimonas sp. SA4125]|uniref:J domain-containing protein n=1 Tax=Aureimonas sp. SA4125 TaxID=2826993 RepID=UPI001CC4F2D0|nr:DnaJ family molecular chaperone [Aureimonas sp. SA4125]BDA85597.1 molecular chaperone DjlA [Aureimonas sp. SA4125]
MQIVWSLGALVQALPSQGMQTLDALLERIHALFDSDKEKRRQVAFSVAMIALSAKMAKADGVVSQAEIAAFQQIFSIPADEMRNVFRLYDLARRDIAGYEAYAAKMAALCDEGERSCALLADVLDGLFHIAKADGMVHPRELAFLRQIAVVFGLTEAEFASIRYRHVATGSDGPFAVLGLDPGEGTERVRARYLELVKENHPDRLAARGVPDEFMAIGIERMKAINAAYAIVAKGRAP